MEAIQFTKSIIPIQHHLCCCELEHSRLLRAFCFCDLTYLPQTSVKNGSTPCVKVHASEVALHWTVMSQSYHIREKQVAHQLWVRGLRLPRTRNNAFCFHLVFRPWPPFVWGYGDQRQVWRGGNEKPQSTIGSFWFYFLPLQVYKVELV